MFIDKSTPTDAYVPSGDLPFSRSHFCDHLPTASLLFCYQMRLAHMYSYRSVSDRVFLEKATENTLEIYQNIMWTVENRYSPVIEIFAEGTRERRVAIGFKMYLPFSQVCKFVTNFKLPHLISTQNALSNLYHFHSLYVEAVAAGITVNCLPPFQQSPP